MTKKNVATKLPHAIPADLRKSISGDRKVKAVWDSITPLAQNPWICWVTSGKLPETRNIRIEKALSKMRSGMRRPCCWIGCIHRTDKATSPSARGAQPRI